MSRFLRFLSVFVVAIACAFSAFSVNAAVQPVINVCDEWGDAIGNECVHFGGDKAGAPTSFTTLNSSTRLTNFPYKPGYGYGGHWTGRNCSGTQILTHLGRWTGNTTDEENIYACWIVMTQINVNNPQNNKYVFVPSANGGTDVGNYWAGYQGVSLPQIASVNAYQLNTQNQNINIRYENRGDWMYLSRNGPDSIWWALLNIPFDRSMNWYFTQDGFYSEQYPTRSGYVFDGFSTITGTSVIDSTGASSSATLLNLWNGNPGNYTPILAQWRPAVYHVTFATGGSYGTGVQPGSVWLRYGSGWYDTAEHAELGGTGSGSGLITGLTNLPQNGNLDFKGYYIGENGNGTPVVEVDGTFVDPTTLTAITSDVTVYPYWTQPSVRWVSITLDDNNTTGSFGNHSERKLYYSSDCNEPGYRTTRDCAAAVVEYVSIPSYSNHYYYGHYFNANGSNVLRIRYDGLIIGTGRPAEGDTWVADWSPDTFSVSYNGNGASGNAPSSPTTCTYGGTCSAPANTYTVPSGKEFGGWSCVVNGTNAQGAAATVPCAQAVYQANQNLSSAIAVNGIGHVTGITLSPNWVDQTIAFYTISLNPGGGSGGVQRFYQGTNNEGWFYAQNSGAQITTNPPNIFTSLELGGGGLSKPQKSNYYFDGYATASGTRVINADGDIEPGVSFSGNTVLTAQWSVATTVSLELNCGTDCFSGTCSACSVTQISAVAGHAFPTISCAPTRDESTFVGYADYDGNMYYNYNGVSLIPTGTAWPTSGPEHLYAVWERTSYDVNYHCSQNGTTVYSDDAYKDCPSYTTQVGGTPNRCPNQAATSTQLGQKFTHWYLSDDINATWNGGASVAWPYNTAKDLVAGYKSIYRVTLNHNGAGNTPSPDVVYFSNGNWYSDSSATVPLSSMTTKPTMAGYRFTGYKLERPGNTSITMVNSDGVFQTSNDITNAINANNLTIKADWSLIAYHVNMDQQFDASATSTTDGTEDIYYKVTTGWVESEGSSVPISSITAPTQTLPSNQTQKVFSGYYTEQNGGGTQVIDGTGQIQVTGNDALALFASETEIKLYAKWNDAQSAPTNPNEYFAVTTTELAANTTFSFVISAAGDFWVDWGDGFVEHIVREIASYNYSQYSHTYTNAAPNGKTIKIWRTAGTTPAYTSAGIAAISFGDAYQSTPSLVAGISGSLGAVFPTVGNSGDITTVPSFNGTFYNCTNLEGDIADLENLFSWVDSNQVVQGVKGARNSMFATTFYNTGLSGTIPSGLFKGVSGSEQMMFYETFGECSNLDGIGTGLFDTVSGAASSMFYGTFQDCTGIESIPPSLFSGVSGSAGFLFTYTFHNTGITSIPAGLFSGVSGVAESMFSGTFRGCDSLETVPNGLFSGVSVTEATDYTASYMFQSTFEECSSLTELPSSLFGTIDASLVNTSAMFNRMFTNDTALEGYVPKTLFANVINYSNNNNGIMSLIFSGCSNLATSCDSYDMTQYQTGFENYWSGHVSCAPVATFSCYNSEVEGGSGTPNPSLIWADDVANGTVTVFPNGNVCSAPSNYSMGNYGYGMWKCTGATWCENASWSANNLTSLPSGLGNVTQNVAFYMTYIPNNYSVTLSANGGNAGTVSTLWENYDNYWSLSEGGASITGLTSAQLPSRSGYTFTGFYDTDAATGGNMMINASGDIVASTTTLTDSNQTWYARWQSGPYTVTFKCDTDGEPITNYSWSNIQNGSSINVPAATSSVCAKTGYSFTQWKIVANNTLIPTANNGGTYTWGYSYGSDIIPNWVPVEKTISLNAHIGNNVNTTLSDAGQSTIYTRYATGVYRNSGRTELMTTGDNPLTQGPVQYANVSFDPGTNGTLDVGGTSYNHTNQYALPVNIPFEGYYPSASGGSTPYIGSNKYITAAGRSHGDYITSNETWHAHWSNVNLTNNHFQYQNVSFSGLVPTRSGGYVFDGWYTTADDTGNRIVQNANGQILEQDSTGDTTPVVITENTTWYAHWTQCAATADAVGTSHATRTAVASVNGQCVYTITCELCSDNTQDCYSQQGGLLPPGQTHVSSFDITTSQTSGILTNAVCLPRAYYINYENMQGATLPSTGMPESYTYGVGATINGVPTLFNQEFQGWCTTANGQNCPDSQTITSPNAHGAKTFWAEWDCATGYMVYDYDMNTIEYGSNISYYYAGECAPIRYRVTCDSNCPEGPGTCNACLEDFYLKMLSQPNAMSGYVWGFVYNSKAINTADFSIAGLPIPVREVAYTPIWPTLFTEDPKYQTIDMSWPNGLIASWEDTGLLDEWFTGNYRTFMEALAEESYNSTKSFGAPHYEFDGLWTAASGGDVYIEADGFGPNNALINGQTMSKFFTQDTTVYAHWEPHTYTVTLNNAGGTGGAPNLFEKYGESWAAGAAGSMSGGGLNFSPTAQFNMSAQLPQAPDQGHSFGGYYTQASCNGDQIIKPDGTLNTNAPNSGVGSITDAKYFGDNNSTLYACWTSNQYTVTYNCGAPMGPDGTVQTGSGYVHTNGATFGGQYTPKSLTEANCVTHVDGYYFNGWGVSDTVADIKQAGTPFNWLYTENKTFTARWVARTYHVTFDKVGGQNGTSEVWLLYGSEWRNAANGNSISTITAPTKNQYTFAGYYQNSTEIIPYTGILPTKYTYLGESNDVTLTAHWNEVDQTITLNGNGATTAGTTSLVARPSGVYLNGTQMVVGVTPISLPARAYTVSFNLNNGNLGGTQAAQTATYGFNGYYLNASASTAYINSAGQLTLEGNNAGTGYETDMEWLARWTSGSTLLPLPNGNYWPTNNLFMGWYTETENGSLAGWHNADYTPTQNVTLHAHWAECDYSVGNYSTATMTGVDKTDDRCGYHIVCETGHNHNGDMEFNYLGDPGVPTGTLPGCDGDTGYTIKYYDKNNNQISVGSNWSTWPTTYTISNSAIDLPAASDSHIPLVTGYAFDSWCSDSTRTTCGITQIAAGATGDKMFYAKYTIQTNNITYYGRNSDNSADVLLTGLTPASYTINDLPVGLPSTITTGVPVGYSFDSWCSDLERETCGITQITAPWTTGNKTFYAKFTPNWYNINYNYAGGTATLPENYMPVQYITFNGAQYIDTGTTIKKGYEVQAKFYPTGTSKYLYGARSAGDTASVSAYIGGNWRWGNKTKNLGSNVPATNAVHTIIHNATGITLDGTLNAYSETPDDFETPASLAVGANHTTSGYATGDRFNGRVYWFKIFDGNGALVYNGVPVKNTDTGEYGLCNFVIGMTEADCVTMSDITGPNKTALPDGYWYGDTTKISGIPARAHSVFAGWCEGSATCANPQAIYTISNTTTGDKNMYAQWTCEAGYHAEGSTCVGNTITIVYNNGGHGTAPASDTCTYGGTLGLPARIADADGYTFNKWATATGKNFNQNTQIDCNADNLGVTSGTATITATWSPKCFRIALNKNGGVQGSVAILYKKTNGTTWYTDSSCATPYVATNSIIPTRENYTFRGFYSTQLGDVNADAAVNAGGNNTTGTLYIGNNAYTTSDGDAWTITQNSRLYAAWARDCVAPDNGTCTLNINQVNGTATCDLTQNPRVEGTCGGVDYVTSCETGYSIGNNNAYNPTCTANAIIVTLNKNGGSGTCGGENSQVTCYYNQPCTLPAWETGNTNTCALSKTGNLFGGWQSTAAGGTSYGTATSSSITVTEPTTVYATWTPVDCQVDNGSATSTVSNNTPTCNLTCDTGYTATNSEHTGTQHNPVVATGECHNATYNIYYHYNEDSGGALEPGYNFPSTYTYGTAVQISGVATRPNHVFQSWCTDVSDNSTCDSPYEISANSTGDVILHAKWSCNPGYTWQNNTCVPNTITVWFANGGHGGQTNPQSRTCTYGDGSTPATRVQMHSEMYETGWVFGGWMLNGELRNANANLPCNFETLGVYSGDVTATAQWSAQGWPVRYSCGDGTGDAPGDGNATYLMPFLTASNTCTRPGYTFDGWLLTEENVTKGENESFSWIYTNPSNTGDFHFVAQWQYNPVFTVTTVSMTASETDAAKRTISFKLAAKGTFVIDWDNGQDLQTIVSNSASATTYTHVYSGADFGGQSTKSFVIKFGGKATLYSETYNVPAITFYNGTSSANGTEVNIAGIAGCLGCIFPTVGTGGAYTTQPRFYQTFRNAKNMTTNIGTLTHLFDEISGSIRPYMFAALFRDCSGMTGSIPAGLFGNASGLPMTYMFARTFQGCSGLTGTIPSGLFANVSGAPALSMFESTFQGCTGLTGIQSGLFSGISGQPYKNMFGSTFSGSGLTSIPAGLFGGVSGQPKEAMYYRTFYNCAGLTSIPSSETMGLFGNISGAPDLNMFKETFAKCKNIASTIPANLFRGNGTGISGTPAEGMFQSTFSECEKVHGPIPSGLFGVPSGAPAKNMFYGTFYKCYLLDGEIPSRLFGDLSGAPAEGMFQVTFQNAAVSGQIPANLFRGNGTGISGAPAVNMFRATFYGCSNLIDEIPSGLFGTLNGPVASGMFRNTFGLCSGLTGTIPSNLFRGNGTLTGSAAEMFYQTFNGASGLDGYVPSGLFSNIDVPVDLASAPENMMTNVFLGTGLLTECPCGTVEVPTGLRDLYWNETTGSNPPRAISCAVDTSGTYYWYDGQCSEICPAASIDELHAGSLNFPVLKSKIKVPSINIRYTDPTVGDTTCYVPMVSGNGGTNSLNMSYAGDVYHAVMATTTPPEGFGQR